ncbi:FAD-dependent oxidoreductase [Glycomyces niveus]|uniref:FAD-dependent oxidoreductase n=1 Tax=Glycomyces niveus TaxID=2820287 RepID=A0ABS3U1A9_9ACTN|nr:FAD-dependent oxidoreductase [Glycomyces sp. NEAU-S30]MBO3732565.1 FAD-dependent oxidoreductase [Glycomyces sp. NEAU-S30]
MRIAIVGAGSIGLAVAWRAAQSGAEVVVHDPDPGSGASRVAAGMIAPVTESHYGEEALGPFMAASADAWPGFARALEAASGLDVDFRDVPTLVVGVEDGDRAEIDRQAELYRLTARNVEPLTARAARKVEPLLSHKVRGGVLAPEDRAVDPRVVHDALLIAAERAGVGLRTESVEDLAALDADQVVIAAGCGSANFSGTGASASMGSEPGDAGAGKRGTRVSGAEFEPRAALASGAVSEAGGEHSGTGERSERGTDAEARGESPGAAARVGGSGDPDARWSLPVRAVRGAVLRLRAVGDQPLPRTTVRGFVKGHPIYIVTRESGEVVVGASSDERGFDRRTGTAGAVHDLLRRAIELVPEIAEYHLDEVSVGFRPGTPDNLPLIGRLDPRTIAATGHYRNGIALIPATASAVAALLAGNERAVPAAFDPRRFEGAGRPSGSRFASAPESMVTAGSDTAGGSRLDRGLSVTDDISTQEADS